MRLSQGHLWRELPQGNRIAIGSICDLREVSAYLQGLCRPAGKRRISSSGNILPIGSIELYQNRVLRREHGRQICKRAFLKKNFYQGLAVSASALLLAACGGEAGDDGSAQSAEIEAPTQTTTDATVEEAAPSVPAADDVATVDGTTLADFTGDAANGENAFLQCKACHVVDEGVNRVGPSLAGIIGRKAGTVDGFSYTEANANSGNVWTPEKMFQYLEDPRRVIPGTRMAYAGLKDGQKRADLIAYLQAQ